MLSFLPQPVSGSNLAKITPDPFADHFGTIRLHHQLKASAPVCIRLDVLPRTMNNPTRIEPCFYNIIMRRSRRTTSYKRANLFYFQHICMLLIVVGVSE